MGLFGGGVEKEAKKAAAQAESDRLAALPVQDLAAEVMQAFGPDGLQIKSGHQQGALQVAGWLLRDFSTKVKYTQPVFGPTIEALGILDTAGLVDGRNFGSGNAKTYNVTRLGETALAEGDVRERLGA
ncbi:MAG: hypothetical protein JJE13_03215 [Thermoleophilia bacterium]|nr:hypothetical protein [Thermoleophilia bacterium]